LLPITALAKKGDKNFRRGMDYEAAQRWDKAAQEYTLAVAADPSNMEYQLHFRRASFNASQTFMQQGRALADQRDFVGAYNAFRQAYGYDPVNELAVSEMERMLYLQNVKEGKPTNTNGSRGGEQQETSLTPVSAQQQELTAPHTEQLRVISYNGDLKAFIRSLADQLSLNVIFDRQSFAQARNLDINLKDVTTAQALDYIFLQESLFFQKLSRRTILVADQARRPQYQQLVLRTFYLSNMKPTDARTLVQQAIPPSVGRAQDRLRGPRARSISGRWGLGMIADRLFLRRSPIKHSPRKDRSSTPRARILETSASRLLRNGTPVRTWSFLRLSLRG